MAEEALRYNEGKPQWSLVNFQSLEPMVRVLEYGAHKYSLFKDKDGNLIKGSDISIEESKDLELISSGKDNWKLGFDNKKLLESLFRHLILLMDGEQIDSESRLPHIGHVLANSMFYAYHSKKKSNE